MDQTVDRRSFLIGVGSAALGLPAGGAAKDGGPSPLPTRLLGKTGVRVPILGLGTATAGFRPYRETVQFYRYAISRGVTYLDTAPSFAGYGHAQRALGEAIRDCRRHVFVVTKCWEPDGEAALRLLKANLRELGTEYADLVYAHSIGSDKMEPSVVMGERGVLRSLEKARRDGLCRFIGVSGHNRPARFLKVLDEFEIDVMMTAVSFVARHIYGFEDKVWPVAHEKGVGLVAMKVFGGMGHGTSRPKGARIAGRDVPIAFRYAYSLPGLSTAVFGCHDRQELDQLILWLDGVGTLTDEERRYLDRRGRELAARWGEVYGPVA